MSANGARILVVDDEHSLVLLARTVLEGDGHQVTSAATVDEAMAALAHNRFDVMLCDVVLQGAPQGLTIARWASEHHPWMKTIISSGLLIAQENTGPVFAVLEKPYRITRLSRLVDEALALARAEESNSAAPNPTDTRPAAPAAPDADAPDAAAEQQNSTVDRPRR